ncbi:MAG: radical SAM family heme chaperone HemW [Bacteroidetes bacterium]|nr:radical SAM family heme chaperone HemW [Bacteroidota bacterium]
MPGLYIHIPFCEKKCMYCDFFSTETFRQYDSFLSALHTEIYLRARLLADTPAFDSVFFGGGTPSLLGDVQLGGILEALHGRFDITQDAEITVECNPGTVDVDSLRGYRDAGVNRLSFGVQSFHSDDLLFLGRTHTVEEAEAGILMAQDAGIPNVNLDLMFSLPGQTPERWHYNLERARALGTTHLSCYSLTVEKDTPLERMVACGMVIMPPEESDAALFELTMQTLDAWGYCRYEVSNYALPGYECRHNLTYWRHGEYIGFGPSAYSTFHNRRWWNVRDVERYVEALVAGTLPEAGEEELTPETQRGEYIFLRLRSEGIDLAEFRRRFSTDLLADNRAFIDHCISDGLLYSDGNVLRLTPGGVLVCDEICVELR